RRRGFVLESAPLECGKQIVGVGDEHIGSAHELAGPAGIEHVRRRDALTTEASLRPNDLGNVGQEGDDIVFDLALDGIDTRKVETRIPSLLPDFFRGLLRNYPKLGHGVSRMRLDFEPEAIPRLRVPDRGYFR